MKSKINLFLFFILLPLVIQGQQNEYIEFTEKYAPAFDRKINSVKIKYNKKRYKEITDGYNKYLEGKNKVKPYGYAEHIYFDFFKKATKIKTGNGYCYALHFELEKGEAMTFDIDTFSIPTGTYMVLADIKGNEIKEYSYNMKPRQWAGREVFNIGERETPMKELILFINIEEGLPIAGSKITFFTIGVNVIDISKNKSLPKEDSLDNTVARRKALKAGIDPACLFNVVCMPVTCKPYRPYDR